MRTTGPSSRSADSAMARPRLFITLGIGLLLFTVAAGVGSGTLAVEDMRCSRCGTTGISMRIASRSACVPTGLARSAGPLKPTSPHSHSWSPRGCRVVNGFIVCSF